MLFKTTFKLHLNV
ncbi:hypothetical protein Zm00014a_037027 [Zea mays]|uniref:Uncharacterized protein n=1 Tax=Zea mays TaxID=4577 RepID=A0A3L6DQK7_MAIZE|nr:hypothetical protein Zm00014a_037027 [Zea mays]